MGVKRLLNQELRVISLVIIVILGVPACSQSSSALPTTLTQTHSPSQSSPGASQIQATLPTPTTRSYPTLMPTAETEMLRNPSFERGVDGWEVRFGEFLHITDASYSGLGSGRLVTSTVDARGDYSGLVAQCVPIAADALTVAGTGAMRLKVVFHINASGGDSFFNLAGVFTEGKQCQGAQVGIFSLPTPDAGDGWVLIEGEIDIPPQARSLDLLISCSGTGSSSSILVDDVHLAPLEEP